MDISILIEGSGRTTGGAYAWLRWAEVRTAAVQRGAVKADSAPPPSAEVRAVLMRFSAVVFITAAISSIVFQSTTFALPNIFDERLQGIAASMAEAWKTGGGAGRSDVATMVGMFAFAAFAIAPLAQLVAGKLLDHFGPRSIFMGAAIIQIVFFAAMPGLHEGIALAVAFGFMLSAFGQIPMNDFLIGKMASGQYRACIYAVRYVVSFTVLAATLPFVRWSTTTGDSTRCFACSRCWRY